MSDFFLTIPEHGWFSIGVGQTSAHVSYLCEPFHDISKLIFNRAFYNISGGVFLDGEGENSALHYSSDSETLYLKDIEANYNKGVLDFSNIEDIIYISSLLAIQSEWLTYGENAFHFSILDKEMDLEMEDEGNSSVVMDTIWNRHFNKERYDVLKDVLPATRNYAQILNNWHHIPKYLRNSNTDSMQVMRAISLGEHNVDADINPKYLRVICENIHALRAILKINPDNEFSLRKLIQDIIYGNWVSYIEQLSPGFNQNRRLDLNRENALLFYLGVKSIGEFIYRGRHSGKYYTDRISIIIQVLKEYNGSAKYKKDLNHIKKIIENRYDYGPRVF